MKMEVGDLLFVKGDCYQSRFIRFFLKSDYTHVTIAMDDTHICEVDIFTTMKVMKNPYTEFSLYRLNRKLTNDEKEELRNFLLEKCRTSKGYDWWRLLSIGIKKFFRWNIIVHEQDRYFCSEIIDKAYQHIGIDLVKERVTGDVTPIHIMDSKLISLVHSKYKIDSISG
jgi:hypothetical protein